MNFSNFFSKNSKFLQFQWYRTSFLPSFFSFFFFSPLKKFCRVIGMAITIRDSHFSSRSPFSRSTTAIDQKEPRLILRRTRSSRFSSRNIIIISLRFFFFFLFRGMEMREWEICFWKVSIATTTVLSFLIFVHWLHIHIYICMYVYPQQRAISVAQRESRARMMYHDWRNCYVVAKVDPTLFEISPVIIRSRLAEDTLENSNDRQGRNWKRKEEKFWLIRDDNRVAFALFLFFSSRSSSFLSFSSLFCLFFFLFFLLPPFLFLELEINLFHLCFVVLTRWGKNKMEGEEKVSVRQIRDTIVSRMNHWIIFVALLHTFATHPRRSPRFSIEFYSIAISHLES